MSSPSEIATAFIQHYYQTLNTNPDALAGLYQPTSVFSLEGNEHTGPEAIVAALKTPGQMQHDISGLTIDTQMSVNQNALVILVTGKLKLVTQENPLQFSQMFQLVANGPGNYYLHNDCLRLVYG
mmetsp:Transcript_28580/g.36949  ORF Transcript_28580/g.36949 Transcript_28580/m.36949 type:complete len:125 (+) Transcript_28580:19-393(+)